MLSRAKISNYKIEKIIKHFCVDIIASKTAALLGMNRNTINHWYMVFRKAIYAHQMKEFEKIIGEAEVAPGFFVRRVEDRVLDDDLSHAILSCNDSQTLGTQKAARDAAGANGPRVTVPRLPFDVSACIVPPDVPLHQGVFRCVKAGEILHVINMEVNSDASGRFALKPHLQCEAANLSGILSSPICDF